jgi:ribonuclease T
VYKRQSFDTATLGGIAFGQTVLSRAVTAAGIAWDPAGAHSAIYDAERTAELFCTVCNRFRFMYEEALTRMPGPAADDRDPAAAE